MRSISALVALGLINSVSAQAGAWGQCGGSSYTGPTTCQSGWSCVYLNEWFSHCEPATTTLTTSSSTTTSAVTTTKSTSTTTTAPTSPGSTAFAKVDGLNFNINGETKYFAGTNAYWLPFLTNNADVDSVFKHLQQAGLKVLRTWGFNDVNSVPSSGTVYFQLHDKSSGTSTINTGADGLQRLDYVVSAAEKYGIKLIIPFVNNWNDYGGMNAYINAYGGSKTEWYTSAKIQGAYQAYIKAVVSRYKNSPAIFAWELANEARCQSCDTDVIYNWVKQTAVYIKSLDSNHMVTTGEEGMGLTTGSDNSYPYTTYEGNDFAKHISIPEIDFGTFHLYVSDWGISNNSWGNDWIKSHAAACKAAGKPCLFEEYGIKDDHCSDSVTWQATSLATTGMGGDMFWQYGETLSSGASPNDHYTIYYGSSDWQCGVANHVAAI
ncbi:Glycoside hydrolase superfamily [Penicillium coprophilum]|uniref:Glycoside hydrolase superfamily n=1 Tax=Penicillium coprophilum TaxID=36646 RepID=UPI00239F33D2|nr:Glycoside hydrolase superfamily [Penicillium coprophilum]KAJ5159080.1 Glycoside hydrolase superfamily [Penicillium coprophilum]